MFYYNNQFRQQGFIQTRILAYIAATINIYKNTSSLYNHIEVPPCNTNESFFI